MSQRHKTTGRNSFERLLREPGNDLPEARLLPLAQIQHNPAQFRQSFNEATIRELADSIAEQGLIEPLVVRAKDEAFEIVAGERRYRALLLLATEGRGLDGVPVLIRELSDTEAALIIATENLQREDFTIADEAVMYERLISALGLDPERANRELARRLGIHFNRVQRARYLAKHPVVLEAVTNGDITLREGLARISAPQEPEVNYGSSLSPEPVFTEQHVSEHTRRVPGKAWQPFYSAITGIEKMAKQDTSLLARDLTSADRDAMTVKALQAREQLDRLIDVLGQTGGTNEQ
jgi:ParB/RepB/Spo0J family partition protein